MEFFVGRRKSVKSQEAKVQVFFITGHLEDELEVLHKLDEGVLLVLIKFHKFHIRRLLLSLLSSTSQKIHNVFKKVFH